MKKKSSSELKVGIITVLFVFAMYVTLVHMGIVGKKVGQTYTIQFSKAGGITVGASVRYAGVEIGKVTSVVIKPAQAYYYDSKKEEYIWINQPDGKPLMIDQAFVTFMITNDYLFADKNPTFTDKTEILVSSSVMGDKSIEISPKNGKMLDPKLPMRGQPPVTIEDFVAKAEKTVVKLETAIDGVNNILGDPATQKNIKMSLENFKELTGNLKDASSSAKEGMDRIANKVDLLADNANRVLNNVDSQITASGRNIESFTGTLNRIAGSNEGDIRLIVKNLLMTSKSLNNTLQTVEKLVSSKEFNEDILVTLHNIKGASEQIVGIASDIRAVTSDGQLREDLKTAVSEAKETAEGANKLIKGVNGFLGIEKKGDTSIKLDKLMEINAEAEWNKKNGKVSPNANLMLFPKSKASVKLGMDSIGYDNLWNLQYRMGSGALKPRLGIVRSQIGVGTDLSLGKSLGVYVDAYNPRDVNVDITGRVFVKDFYLMGGVRDAFDKKNTVFGVGTRF